MSTPATVEATRSQRVLLNILWNWSGVLVVFGTAFFLSPYLIRKLGDQRYGIWALAFAFIDYFGLLDLGFKPAVVVFVAQAKGLGQTERINRIVNTTFFFFVGIGLFLTAMVILFAPSLADLFHISPEVRSDFIILIRLISVGWGVGMAMNTFNGAMEGLQLFRDQSVIMTFSQLIRSSGCAVALYLGFGMSALGVIVLFTHLMMYTLLFLRFRSNFPEFRLAPSLVSLAMWKELVHYGKHIFVGGLGNILQNQGPPMLVAYFKSEAFVGYYTLPSRLLQNIVDMVARTGYVTVPNVAEMAARGERESIWRMAMYLNRYCFALYVPLGVFLLLYGSDLILRWVGPTFATQSAPLLPAFILMTGYAMAGQFNSSQVLYALSHHRVYTRLLVVESLTALGLMALALPVYGLVGVSWVVCGLALLNRGAITPWLLSRILKFSLTGYLWGIFGRATVMAAGLYALGMGLRSLGITGRNWFELLGVLGLLTAIHYLASLWLLIQPEHRREIIRVIQTQASRLKKR